jgi:hypothetical protein
VGNHDFATADVGPSAVPATAGQPDLILPFLDDQMAGVSARHFALTNLERERVSIEARRQQHAVAIAQVPVEFDDRARAAVKDGLAALVDDGQLQFAHFGQHGELDLLRADQDAQFSLWLALGGLRQHVCK